MSALLTVKLVRAPGFIVHSADGRDLGYFRVESEWQGMAALKNEDGETLVVDMNSGGISGAFRALLQSDAPSEHLVVKASPSFLARLPEQPKESVS